MELRGKNEAEIMEEECLLACSPWFSKPALLCKPSYRSFNQSTVHRAKAVRYRIRDKGQTELLGKEKWRRQLWTDVYGSLEQEAQVEREEGRE